MWEAGSTIMIEVWLAGKGPSLDDYDWSQANQYRFAINEAHELVPDCIGVFACDHPILNKLLNLPICVFVNKIHVPPFHFPIMFEWEHNVHAKDIHATLLVAVQVLHWMGIRRIHLIGCDSLTGEYKYSPLVAKGTNNDNFHSINTRLKKIMGRLTDLEIILEHTECPQKLVL